MDLHNRHRMLRIAVVRVERLDDAVDHEVAAHRDALHSDKRESTTPTERLRRRITDHVGRIGEKTVVCVRAPRAVACLVEKRPSIERRNRREAHHGDSSELGTLHRSLL